jgi:hypothetical protein
LTDAQILASLTGNVRRIPYPGGWLAPPFEGEDTAVVARDGHFSELRVDRRTSRVDGVDLVTRTAQLIAPSLQDLATLASAYAAAFHDTRGASDRRRRRVERSLMRTIRAV